MNFEIENSFVFRTPLRSIDNLRTLKTDNDIKNLLSDEIFLSSIYFASPSLYKKCIEFKRGEGTKEAFDEFKFSLLNYFIRICSRATPFGLFSGCGVGQFGDKNSIILASNKGHNLKLRLDSQVLFRVGKLLSTNPILKQKIKYFSNSSIYKIGKQIRYIEIMNDVDFRLTSVEGSEHLLEILDIAKHGVKIEDLILHFKHVFDKEDLTNYLNSLIENQLLVSELEYQITNQYYLDDLIEFLKDEDDEKIKQTEKDLRNLRKLMSNLENSALHNNELNTLIKNTEIIKDRFTQTSNEIYFQGDVGLKSTFSELSSEIKTKLKRGIYALTKFSDHAIFSMNDFKNEFIERYQDRMVSLTEVLDNENGLGYKNIDESLSFAELLSGIKFKKQLSSSIRLDWNNKNMFFFTKYIEALKSNDSEILLDISDLEKFDDVDESKFPNTISIIASLGKSNNGEELIHLKSIGGSSGVNMIGRFTHLNDELQELGLKLIEHEEKTCDNYVLAEIVHLPDPSLGNILSRASLRPYEIGYLANTNFKRTNSINVEDLYLCVRNNSLQIYSKQLKKFILPKLSNAHNFANSFVPVYRFLSDYQSYEKIRGLSFNLGGLSSFYQYSPRVRFEDIVIARAAWKLYNSDLTKILESKSNQELIHSFKLIKAKFNLPNEFYVVKGDNELYIDSNKIKFLEVFKSICKSKPVIKIVELLFDNKNTIVKNEQNNNFNSEFIFFGKHSKTTKSNLIGFDRIEQDKFLPGDKWIYFKVYCGTKHANQILLSVSNYIDEQNELFENWFFIRYSDPRSHLRLRFQIKNIEKHGECYSDITRIINAHSTHISNIQIDTYKREFSRYGGSNITYFENIFHLDSITYINFVRLTELDPSLKYFHFALLSIDNYLNDFGFSKDEKIIFCQTNVNYFKREVNFDSGMKDDINRKYSNQRKELFKLFFKNEISELDKLFLHRSSKIDEVLKLSKMKKYRENKTEAANILGSVIHMSINRIFPVRPRHHEFIIYDFMLKINKARVHINKHN